MKDKKKKLYININKDDKTLSSEDQIEQESDCIDFVQRARDDNTQYNFDLEHYEVNKPKREIDIITIFEDE